MVPQWLIEQKRDGGELAPDDIRDLIAAYARGDLPDYQMAAFAMAVFFRGMSSAELAAMTDAMMRSGDVLDFSDLPRPTVDKHSTGGIGDKISLPLAPLVAACGAAVPMISGRGLGITGGTLDKLDSIPGYRTALPVDEFRAVLRAVGCSIIGQTDRLAPADKKLYALRDVTGTVPSIPLISASILSKKLAEGAQSLVLDVKHGEGAFMKTRDQAAELARTMVGIGKASGRRMTAFLTAMDDPLGRTAGNALEIRETVETLRGEGPEDVVRLTLALGAEMLVLTGLAPDTAAAESELRRALDSGAGLETFARMVAAHGGDARVAEAPEKTLPQAPAVVEVRAPRAGYVARVSADAIGRVVLLLGGGRRATTDRINYAVGVDALVKRGAHVDAGDTLLRLHAASRAAADELLPRALAAIELSDEPPAPVELIDEVIR